MTGLIVPTCSSCLTFDWHVPSPGGNADKGPYQAPAVSLLWGCSAIKLIPAPFSPHSISPFLGVRGGGKRRDKSLASRYEKMWSHRSEMLNFFFFFITYQLNNLRQIPVIKFLRCLCIFNHQNLVKFGRNPNRLPQEMPDYIKKVLQCFSGSPEGSISNYFFFKQRKLFFLRCVFLSFKTGN